MIPADIVIDRLHEEFMHPTLHLCGLCGNHGYIDTVGKLFSPAGIQCGVRAPCICANGRAIKRALDRQNPKPEPKYTKKQPKTFWMSWWERNEGSTTDLSNLLPGVLYLAISGFRGNDDEATAESAVIAWVEAETEEEAIAAVEPYGPKTQWRFSTQLPPGWFPSDRFNPSEAVRKRLQPKAKKKAKKAKP